jgi:hypothetical protein
MLDEKERRLKRERSESTGLREVPRAAEPPPHPSAKRHRRRMANNARRKKGDDIRNSSVSENLERFTVVAVELLYFWGPNIRQKFLSTLPGAVIAVAGWIGSSYLLGIYFRHFAHYNTTYGTLGAAIALSVWFYWTSFIILVGAKFKSGLLQEVGEGRLLLKDRRRTVTSKPPRETDAAA